MKPVIYNLNSIRPPITGIGRYAIELIQGSLQASLPVSAVHGGKRYGQQTLPGLLKHFENNQKPVGSNWRQLSGRVPFSRDLYRKLDRWQFGRLVNNHKNTDAVYHDINYSTSPDTRSNVSTVYDLSHRLYPDTHPQHRVRFLNRYLARLAASDRQIISISNSVKAELMQAYNITGERIQVTHLAAEDAFQPRTQAECQTHLQQYGLGYKHYVLSVGTLEPRKNLSRVLEAYLSLERSVLTAFPLVIAGPQGWKSRKLENQIAQLQKTGQVIRIGFVPQAQLPFLYAGAATFVYPSLYEGFGLPLLEAMQSGCPTITSNSGALAEVAGESAIQVDPLNCDEIASSLSNLLQDTALHAHYSKLGQQRASHFSWAKTVEQTHKIYNSLGA